MSTSDAQKSAQHEAAVLVRCNCAILGIPDRQCSRRATVGTLCAQHAKMDKPDNRVFRWDWESF